jgi:hypothetical protein
VQRDCHVGDAANAADAGAYQDAGHGLVFVTLRPPASVFERLFRRAHGIDDEIVYLALLLGLHPLIGIEGAVAAVAARNAAGDLARNIGYVELLDFAGAAFALDEALPCGFDAASERREHSHPGDDNTPHTRLRVYAGAVKLAQTA